MIKFCRKRFYCDAGRPERPLYKSTLLNDGSVAVEVIGFDNIQDKINSFAESCSIELIVQRCSRGDFSGLEARQGVFADVTGMPKTYAEVLQKVIDGRNLFDSLSKETKDAFGNDFNRWFASIGESEWFTKMGVRSNSPSDVVEKVVDAVKEIGNE